MITEQISDGALNALFGFFSVFLQGASLGLMRPGQQDEFPGRDAEAPGVLASPSSSLAGQKVTPLAPRVPGRAVPDSGEAPCRSGGTARRRCGPRGAAGLLPGGPGRAAAAPAAASLGDDACPAGRVGSGRAGQRRVSSAAGAALPAAGCRRGPGAGGGRGACAPPGRSVTLQGRPRPVAPQPPRPRCSPPGWASGQAGPAPRRAPG